jgi:hypothetical protein
MSLEIRCEECNAKLRDGDVIYCESCRTVTHSCRDCGTEIDPQDYSYCESCYIALDDKREAAETECGEWEGKYDNFVDEANNEMDDLESKLDDVRTELEESNNKIEDMMEFLKEHFPDALMAYSMIEGKMVLQNE